MQGASRFGYAPVTVAIAITLLAVSPAAASSPIRFAGQIGGLVADSGGRPQPGALVMLYNKQDRLLQRAATDFGGNFSFDDLLPDLYSVRITLSNFVPAMRDRVAVKAGMRSLLDVNLSKVFSSIQIVATVPSPGGLMDESWKWTLRADSSLRPILRLLPVEDAGQRAAARQGEKTAVFADSRGMVKISATDGSETASASGEADLGTQFAFATSLYGGNRVHVSGNVGYASASGAPAAALRTTYSRDVRGAAPSVSVTMRQIYLPGRSNPNGNADAAMPALRTISLSYRDKTEIGDSLTLEYGGEVDMVSFVDRLHYFSPFAKLTYELPNGSLDFTYTSGNARPELGMDPAAQNADLQRELAALAVIPRVTLEGGRARIERGEDYEIGLNQRYGSREFRVSAYSENVSNNTLTVARPGDSLFQGDLLPDLFSTSAVFNAGRFESVGYMASVTQGVGQNYKLAASVGSIGVMEARPGDIATAADLRAAIRSGNRTAVNLRASGTVRETGTRFMADYQWADYRLAMPGPQFSTESARPGPGLNVMLRQPLPSIPGLPWRIEASAELRNMLAQGYLPLTMSGGRQLLLVNTPRTLRGGLAFVF